MVTWDNGNLRNSYTLSVLVFVRSTRRHPVERKQRKSNSGAFIYSGLKWDIFQRKERAGEIIEKIQNTCNALLRSCAERGLGQLKWFGRMWMTGEQQKHYEQRDILYWPRKDINKLRKTATFFLVIGSIWPISEYVETACRWNDATLVLWLF